MGLSTYLIRIDPQEIVTTTGKGAFGPFFHFNFQVATHLPPKPRKYIRLWRYWLPLAILALKHPFKLKVDRLLRGQSIILPFSGSFVVIPHIIVKLCPSHVF